MGITKQKLNLSRRPHVAINQIQVLPGDGESKYRFVYHFGAEQWITEPRPTLLVDITADAGLGLFDICDGPDFCMSDCHSITVTDVAPDGRLTGATSRRPVPTLAQQMAIARAVQAIDGSVLSTFCDAVLDGAPEDALIIADNQVGFKVPPASFEMQVSQSRLRYNACEKTRNALDKSGVLPITVVSRDANKHAIFSRLQLYQGHVGYCTDHHNLLGRAWELVRHQTATPLLQDAVIVMCPEALRTQFSNNHGHIRIADKVLQVQIMLRQNSLGGHCAAIVLPLAEIYDGLLDQLKALRLQLDALPHLQIYILPPPPVHSVDYVALASYLLQEGGPLYRDHENFPGGSILQIGRFGLSTDRRFVQNGKWTADGWRALKAFAIQITGLNFLKSNPFGRAGGSLADQLERRVQLTDGGKPNKTEPSATDHRFSSSIDRRLHRVQSGAVRRDLQPSSVDLGSLVRELLQQTRPQPAHAHPKPQHPKNNKKSHFKK